MMNNLEELVEAIAVWGEERGITVDMSDPDEVRELDEEAIKIRAMAQTLKLGSEFGELCDNIAKGRYDAAKDDIGDMIVVLIMLTEILPETSLLECLQVAYSDIRHRKGYFNGKVFIKEGDA